MQKKVLFLIESLAGGGAEKVLSTIIDHINVTKYDVTLCSIVGGGFYEGVIPSGIKYCSILDRTNANTFSKKIIYSVKYHLIYSWLPTSWIYKFWIPKDCDVEIAFIEGFVTKVLSYSTNSHAKKFAWVHIDMDKYHWTTDVFKNNKEEESAYNRFSEIITVSNIVGNSLKQLFNLKVPVRTIYNPVDSEDIIEKGALAQRNTYGIIRFVSSGRFTEQKAFDRLLRIMKRFKDEGYSAELWLLGDGTFRSDMERFIESNELKDNIRLLGFQSNPYQYMNECDVFVCSSIAEGFSTVITEALILGIPVISTEVSGIREQLGENGEYGIITHNDEESLYKGMKLLLDDAELLTFYKKRSIERGKSFNLRSLMDGVETLIDE